MVEDAGVEGPARGKSELELGDVLGHLREGFQVIGRDWRYLYVNDAVAAQGRRTRAELLGKTMMECYPGIEHTDMFRVLQRCMRDRVAEDLENEFTYPDGQQGWFLLRVTPVPEGVLILSLDITEHKNVQAQLLRAQKMEAFGQLAGGIAHDFNNILTVVASFAALAKDGVAPASQAREDLDEITAAVERAGQLVRKLLDFSRRRSIAPQVLQINDLVAELDRMLRRTLGEQIELETALADALPAVAIDPSAFEQVLLNLAVNARDAMPGGGKLTIETGTAELGAAHRMTRGGAVKPGRYVVLGVSDSGVGMDPATVEQAFEPFFTTKQHGRGTGLGLATCYGIVRQAGGYIWVYSERGQGTTFKIYLPVVGGAASEAAAPAAVPLARHAGKERVLVVEDDEQVRRLCVRALQHAGYEALEAPSPAAAIELAERDSGAIDLLLTDVVMPRMGGRELAETLARARPGLRVLYMSGYTENAIAHQGVLERGVALLEKPFTPEQLAAKVRDVLQP